MMSTPFDAMAPVPAVDAGVLVRLPTASFASQPTSKDLWAEPLDTPGIVPRHLVQSATASFPFLEVLQRLLHRLRFDSTTVEIEKVLALVGLYRVMKPAYNYVKDFFFWACTVQVTIPETDPVARDVLSWISTEVIRKGHTRSAMLITGGTTNFMPGIPPPMRFAGGVPVPHRMDEEVACLPPVGTRIFWIGFRPFLFSRNGSNGSNAMMPGFIMNDRGQMHNALTIYTLGWQLAPLRKFTDLCHELKIKNLTGTTNVYFAGGPSDYDCNGWQCVQKAIRKLDTIDMDEDVKADIVKDAEYYNSEDSRQFFADCGIPYRRGYLFWGPPGTGKSSLSIALAGHLQCDIYHINLASGTMSDGSLHRLFLALPKQCIVVIEDIDSAGIDREQGVSIEPVTITTSPFDPMMSNGIPPPPPVPGPKRHRRVRNTVTLSGLLNAIDGNASQEGRLLIMTSNNPDTLDAALTRPGRVDKRVYFGNMSKSAGKSIFLRMIGRWALAHDTGYTPEEIEQYASEFAERIPADTFTPAQVQNFLQDCRSDPLKALREVDAWVLETRNKTDAMESEKSTTSESTTSTSSSTSIVFSSTTDTDVSETQGDDGALQGPVGEKETQMLSAGEESDEAKK